MLHEKCSNYCSLLSINQPRVNYDLMYRHSKMGANNKMFFHMQIIPRSLVTNEHSAFNTCQQTVTATLNEGKHTKYMVQFWLIFLSVQLFHFFPLHLHRWQAVYINALPLCTNDGCTICFIQWERDYLKNFSTKNDLVSTDSMDEF